MDNPTKTGESRSVISTSTILIISGFILGLSAAQSFGDLSYYITTCGLAGIVAFLALDLAALRREQSEASRGQENMERRLARHVSVSAPVSKEDLSERTRLLEWLKRETETIA
ncbi:hypothetical protein [Planctomicrobium piriforme]|uniref:Uncharacterized protein n=1 Tax=Planctomicrobium piriforme TaxID=1576369 RepID=A0A1I3IGS6_9PLAN|nr:hypothetical protein [Planctomicrobium piriforme]SFI47235.1 hypothetical protein SAMN05421753_109120 [Planctomicrobium piriforme]